MSAEDAREAAAAAEVLLKLVAAHGGSIGNAALRKALAQELGREVAATEYEALRATLLERPSGSGQEEARPVRSAPRGGRYARPNDGPPTALAFETAPSATGVACKASEG